MLRLVILGDVHYYSSGPRRSNILVHRSRTILEHAIRQIAGRPEKPDFLLQIGDMIEGADQTVEQRRADLESAIKIIESAGLPWTWILGNHDCEGFNGHRDALLPYLKRDRAYGELAFGDNIFLLLDTTIPAVRGRWEDGEQQQWLAAALERHRDRRVFIFMHHVPDWSVEDEMYIENGGLLRETYVNCPAVKAVFMGHSHTNRIDTIDGLPEIATGALSSWPLLFRWVEIRDDHLKTWMERVAVPKEILDEARQAIEERPRPWHDEGEVSATLEFRGQEFGGRKFGKR